MKILKHGNKYKEVECKNCGALIAYYDNEVTRYSNCEEWFGEWHSYKREYIECPECKKLIIFKWEIDGKEIVDD